MTIHEVPFHTISTLHTLKALKDVHDKHGLLCDEAEYHRLHSALIDQFREKMPDKVLAETMLAMPIKEVGKLVYSSPDCPLD